MTPKTETPGEPLPGAVVTQYHRCGKPSCRCTAGELHGPYHYRVWREDGQRRKAYVRASEVEETRAACVAWHVRHRAEAGLRKVAKKRMERLIRKYARQAGAVPTPPFLLRRKPTKPVPKQTGIRPCL